MGKNPAEAKKKDQREEKTKNVLYYWYYTKSNGAQGLRKQFRVTEVSKLAQATGK